ncbi:MAG: GNAT family N-acetyltransferase [Anaerolineae bacterium]
MLAVKQTTTGLPIGFSACPATMTDLTEVAEMINTCAHIMIGKPESDEIEIKNEWEKPGFDQTNSTRVVRAPDGQVVGYTEVWDLADPPVQPWVWGRVHPDFEGLGIGSFLLDWAENRVKQAVPRVPDGAQVAMRCGTFSGYEPAKVLFEDRDMTLTRHFWRMAIELDRPIPEPVWPDNIQVITFADKTDLTAVYHTIEDAFKDHWGFVATKNESEEINRWRHFIENDKAHDSTLWFLAMSGDEIVGLSLCRQYITEDKGMGFVDELGVRRPWRRQGVALALLHHTFRVFQERGQKRVGLGVDAASLTSATRLYEKAGMQVTRQFDAYEKVIRPGVDLSTQALESK